MDRTLTAPLMKKVHANLNLVLQVHMAMTLHKNPLARNALQAGQALAALSVAPAVPKESLPAILVLCARTAQEVISSHRIQQEA